LLKKYSKLWVFGDSYTSPFFHVKPADSFWGLAAQALEANTIMNCSRIGNSFSSVQQLLIGMSQEIDWYNDMIFVGIPPLERITIFNENDINTPYRGHKFNTSTWQFESFDIAEHRGLVSMLNFGGDRELIIYSNRRWIETEAMRQIFLLTQWLDSINANYMIINLSRNFDHVDEWEPGRVVSMHCKEHKKCIVFDKTYYNINIGVNRPADSDAPEGHHGPEGNRYFFKKSLLPKLQQCYTQRTQAATPAEVLDTLTEYLEFIHAKRLRT